MAKEKVEKDECCPPKKHHKMHGASNGFYGLGFVGALIYFIQHATTFWIGVYGILKALVWPAILVYKLLGFLKL
ncbi:MAG: hypothetical protein NTW79_03185 [Candidatus Berkelbacteria bacterium]|nr:hypothetical protein [Candidatus Berkelbacteria bacterium]